MIDKQLIESAINIRKEFLKLNSDLDDYMIDVKRLAEYLKNKISDLSKYNDEVIKKPKKDTTVESVTQHIVREMEEIELEEKKIRKKVEAINARMELLQKDENVLYETIRSRYPKLTDDQIRTEIQKNLER